MIAHLTASATAVPRRPSVDRPVGWYRDPQDTRRHRHWDGQRWTAQPSTSYAIPLPLPREAATPPAA